ncbi:MAG: HAD family hydrolase [Chloroflexi bacterium]|nr:HAD family hydrolase [Chloroflexota bacterium]
MIASTLNVRDIHAIIFDMGGTLRTREPDQAVRDAAIARISKLLGVESVSDLYWTELERRYKMYSRWAQEHLVELPEQEIWTRWLAPELPPERIAPVASELTLAWRERHGRLVVRADAADTLVELNRRGYRLGLISNTISSVDVLKSLDAYGWKKYFEVALLSSISGRRKPDPEFFWEATRAMQIEPARCAYLGDRISRDVVGARHAGFGMALIIEPPGKARADEQDQSAKPDALIRSLRELLAIFPSRVK